MIECDICKEFCEEHWDYCPNCEYDLVGDQE